jgi:drug/metabolite transporter (DMT)-like permease
MGSPSRPPVNPLIAILVGILAASTASLFIRFAQDFSPSIVVATYRLGIATLLISPFALTKKRAELGSITKREILLALISGMFLAVHFATWIKSLEYTTVASSVVLVSTVPLWVVLFSPIFLKEPITKPVLSGILLAFVGVIIIAVSDLCTIENGGLVCPPYNSFFRGEAFLGDLLALAGAVAAAMYVIIGRSLRQRVSLLSYVFVVYGMASVVLIALALLSNNPIFGYPKMAYVWFILLALIPQLLGHSSYNYALGYLSAAFVSIMLLGEPIGSTILAYIFLGEVPSILKIFGAILILAGIYIASINDIRNNTKSEEKHHLDHANVNREP